MRQQLFEGNVCVYSIGFCGVFAAIRNFKHFVDNYDSNMINKSSRIKTSFVLK